MLCKNLTFHIAIYLGGGGGGGEGLLGGGGADGLDAIYPLTAPPKTAPPNALNPLLTPVIGLKAPVTAPPTTEA